MVLLCCITDREKKAAHGMSIFCIDTTLPGFKKGKVLKKGFQGYSSINDCRMLVLDANSITTTFRRQHSSPTSM